MDWGVHLPQLGRSATRDNLIEFAQAAESLGMHSGWVSDHVAWPRHIESKYPYTDDGSFPGGFDMPWLDPFGALLFVAACTERLKLGFTVLILGYRPPILTAKLASTLAVLSEDRFLFGIGVGWMREEFEVLDMPFDHRGARADEQLEVIEKLVTPSMPSASVLRNFSMCSMSLARCQMPAALLSHFHRSKRVVYRPLFCKPIQFS